MTRMRSASTSDRPSVSEADSPESKRRLGFVYRHSEPSYRAMVQRDGLGRCTVRTQAKIYKAQESASAAPGLGPVSASAHI